MIFKKKPSGKRIALVILNVILSVTFVFLLSVTVYVEWVLDRFYRDPAEEIILSQEQMDALLQEDLEQTKPSGVTEVKPENVDWSGVEKVDPSEYIFNILLVGQDRRPNELRARSDTMILLTVNTREYTITMTSFMRDLFVQIPGYASNRLNVPYAFGGFELLAETMEMNFGIRPDKYIEVDFDGFKSVIDAVGGIDISLSAAEVAYFNRVFHFGVTEGINHLNSQQALEYARCRSVEGDADFSRTRRQRAVISAVIEKSRTLNLAQINEMVLAMTDVLTTNLTSAEIMSFVVRFYPMLDKLGTPKELRIPADNAFYSAWAEGIGSVLVPDLKINSAVVAATQK